MLYQRTLNVPASTTETAPATATLKLCAGVSTRREIVFPDGCCGLCHVRVNHGGWQLMPWSRDEWLAADGETVIDGSPYPLDETMNTLTIIAYNEDTVNAHEVQVRVTMHEGVSDEFLNLGQFLDALRGA
ncbi:MAG: hypothetical protein KKF27_20205 [Gammaproteobacteria bacterium]|nr:hypothetical protein [Gammaproteobacteria bacterium]